MAHGRKYQAARAAIDPDRVYTPLEAVRLLKALDTARFDETVEVHFRLGVDVRHADQIVRGTTILPHGTGRSMRVAVFAEGEKAREATEAGADIVGTDDLAKRVQDGQLDFDVAIATPDMMGVVGRLGRILGPRGLMPNPKSGTVTFDVAKAVSEAKAGKVEYRTDRSGIIHLSIGKKSFDETPARRELRRRARRDRACQAGGLQGPLPEERQSDLDHGPVDRARLDPHARPARRVRQERRRPAGTRSCQPAGEDLYCAVAALRAPQPMKVGAPMRERKGPREARPPEARSEASSA